ncbi:MmgE/PrpD family protein [Sphingomonas sp. MMS24-J13]|uniref:MmgE/PrpD family protein n=1 Tax=Sphingomonas sp. MMS24-J13 TaxID=3238686 RepID=UPI00384A644F
MRDAARLRLFDTLVAARIGRALPEAAPLAKLAVDAPGRIRALVATVRATEVDDIALAGCVTAGSVIVPVALLAAAERDCDSDALLRAIVAGYEAMVGFAAAIGGATILYRGIWPTLAAAPIGAAAVAGSLARLDRQAMLSALALAIGRSPWWLDRGLPRWLQLGHAAADGVAAAQAAEAGFTAPASVIDGWANASGVTVDPALLAPGAVPKIHQIECKTFPTARQGLSAIQAFMRLHADRPVGPTDRIEIALPGVYRAMVGGTTMPAERIGSMLSAAYQMALAVHAPERMFDAVHTPPCNDPAIADFLTRVVVTEDAALDALYPRQWGARVTIVGAEARTCEVLSPEGGADHPFGWTELAAKAASLALGLGLPATHFEALQDSIRKDVRPGDLLTLALS